MVGEPAINDQQEVGHGDVGREQFAQRAGQQ